MAAKVRIRASLLSAGAGHNLLSVQVELENRIVLGIQFQRTVSK
jgi:hypothetical protein